jgi:hypothetical protein
LAPIGNDLRAGVNEEVMKRFQGMKKGGARSRFRPPPRVTSRLAQVVRNIVVGRVQLVADALHGTDRSNGYELWKNG